MTLADYDWRFIHNLTYRIHAISDFTQMRKDFLKYLELGIHYDKAFWGLVNKSRTPRIYDVINLGYEDESMREYIEHPISDEPVRMVSSSSKSYVYRRTDLYNTEREWEESTYFKQFSKPNGIHYFLVMGLVYEQKQIATLTFARKKESADFSNRDVEIFNLLKDHLALRVNQHIAENSHQQKQAKTEEPALLSILDKGLTKREFEVIQCLRRGDTTAEICENLFISQTTLKKHITNAYRKLGIHSRGQINKLKL